MTIANFDLKLTNFGIALRKLWQRLIFRKIKKIVTNDNDINGGINYYLTENREIGVKCYNNLEIAYSEIPKEKMDNFRITFDHYYGFTDKSFISSVEPHYLKNHNIFFGNNNRSEINFDDNAKLFFGPTEECFIPPKKGQIICGLVNSNNKGYYFSKWFVCSYQFYLLWLVVCDPDKIIEKGLCNKDYILTDNLFNSLDTSKLSNINNCNSKYKYYNYEEGAILWSDRYIKIARLCYDSNFIKKIKKKYKSRNNFNKQNIMAKIKATFEEKVYSNVLLIVNGYHDLE